VRCSPLYTELEMFVLRYLMFHYSTIGFSDTFGFSWNSLISSHTPGIKVISSAS
jgi:hypothetical protein